MSYDGYEAPDGIEPLVGYRGWKVIDGALWSVYPEIRAVEWPISGPLASECLPPRIRTTSDDNRRVSDPPKHYWSPHLDCTCGIYALHEYPEAWESMEDGRRRKSIYPWPPKSVTGIIHGWGHIIVGDRGFRAQTARPIALVSGRNRYGEWPTTIQQIAERYGIEIVDYREVRK